MLCDDCLHYRSLPTKFYNLNIHFIKQEKLGWSSMKHLWIHLMMNPIPSHLEYPSLHFKVLIFPNGFAYQMVVSRVMRALNSRKRYEWVCRKGSAFRCCMRKSARN
ncbi:hypothetical protein VPH35_020641 [Triticum aestivum]